MQTLISKETSCMHFLQTSSIGIIISEIPSWHWLDFFRPVIQNCKSGRLIQRLRLAAVARKHKLRKKQFLLSNNSHLDATAGTVYCRSSDSNLLQVPSCFSLFFVEIHVYFNLLNWCTTINKTKTDKKTLWRGGINLDAATCLPELYFTDEPESYT